VRGFAILAVLAVVAAVLATRTEPFAPQAILEPSVDLLGRATPLRVVARDRGSGLRRVEVRLVAPGAAPVLVASEDFPRRSWWGSEVHEAVLTPTVDASAAHVPEGPATLEVWASDHSWLAAMRRQPTLTHAVTVKLTPPTLEALTSQHVVRQGGSECAVYRAGTDAVESGVQVGDRLFPGVAGLFQDATLRAALFTVPPDGSGGPPTLVAQDAAGNRRTVALDVATHPRKLPEKTLVLDDAFLARKVPELLHAGGLEDNGDLAAGYLRINRELRAATEVQVRGLCRESAPRPLWKGAFLRLPGAAPLAGFADLRSYVYRGNVIDHQMHLGFDLAALRANPVPAGNDGRVVFAGPLGIYGNAVLLDHGLGLFSLYGHLSEIAVSRGATVERGDLLGKTGETGLAGGDHLHFSMLLHGTYVDPVEWWDEHWIHDHVTSRLAAFPPAGAGTQDGGS
jgi:murein DD-endopeptidase MepM/ murein hydrolase activator NlpD